MTVCRCLLTFVVLGLSPVLSGAHHPLDELFDRDSTLTLTGEVTGIQWTNPHVVLEIAVENESGEVVSWRVGMDPPNALLRKGWSPDMLAAGDVVTVTGFRALDGGPTTEARTVALADGESLTLAASDAASWGWRTVSPAP